MGTFQLQIMKANGFDYFHVTSSYSRNLLYFLLFSTFHKKCSKNSNETYKNKIFSYILMFLMKIFNKN